MIELLIGIILLTILLIFIITIFIKNILKNNKIINGSYENNFYEKNMDEIINLSSCESILYFDDIKKSLKYESGVKTPGIHVGQLKLMLTELEFLTEFLENKNDKILFVYAGSAPSNHLSHIADLFPNVKFLLVDPNEHVIMFEDIELNVKNHYNDNFSDQVLYFKLSKRFRTKENIDEKINIYDFSDNIIKKISRDSEKFSFGVEHQISKIIENTDYRYYILEDLFTNELANEISKTKMPLYFCSDIRTNVGKTNFSDLPEDLDILFNSAMQLEWLNIMKPIKSMLKFRCPYFNKNESFNPEKYMDIFDRIKNKIDFIKNYKNNKFIYFQPYKIYLQSFPGPSSTETRLIVDKETIINNNYYEYDSVEYENKLFYYNKIIRPFCFHNNKEYFEFGVDGCGDCDLMINIYKMYYLKFYKKIKMVDMIDNIKEKIKSVMNIIGRTLKIHKHGYFTDPYDADKLFRLISSL